MKITIKSLELATAALKAHSDICNVLCIPQTSHPTCPSIRWSLLHSTGSLGAFPGTSLVHLHLLPQGFPTFFLSSPPLPVILLLPFSPAPFPKLSLVSFLPQHPACITVPHSYSPAGGDGAGEECSFWYTSFKTSDMVKAGAARLSPMISRSNTFHRLDHAQAESPNAMGIGQAWVCH